MENHHHQQQQQQQHQHLPDEISMEILSRLPVDSTLQCRRVCKAWRSIIDNDLVFRDMHLRQLTSFSSARLDSFVVLESVKNSFSMEHYVRFAEPKRNDQEIMRYNKRWKLPFIDTTSEIHRSLTIVGSCNGLICISTIPDYDTNGSHYTFVCNPWTREVVNLSDSSINSNHTSSSSSTSTDHEHELLDYSTLSLEKIGFGYLPSTDEYKIVRIYSSEEGRIRHVQVYTLGSRCGWRTIVPQISWSDITFSISYTIREVSKLGVSVNGALYFNNCRNIVSFDLAKGEFKIINPPPPFNTDIDGIGVLGGCLCATKNRFSTNNSTISTASTDLWVMEKDHKDNKQVKEESWIKKFSLPQEGGEEFFRYIPLGGGLAPPRILLQTKWKKSIVSYNPETHKSCCNNISYEYNDMPSSINQIIPYVKSCVFLKNLGETVQIKEIRGVEEPSAKRDHGSNMLYLQGALHSRKRKGRRKYLISSNR